jgi:hypothetical protein
MWRISSLAIFESVMVDWFGLASIAMDVPDVVFVIEKRAACTSYAVTCIYDLRNASDGDWNGQVV